MVRQSVLCCMSIIVIGVIFLQACCATPQLCLARLLQLMKAQQVTAAVPAALARIRSSHSDLAQIPSLSEGGGTPFRAAPLNPDEDQSVDDILKKLSPEYRADVARMLIRSASKALPDRRQG